ncbi:phosphatase [bacterium]|nr:MAG: phosphatase [bacterium]
MNLLADLHTHTVHSDGVLTVKQLFEKTKKIGLSGLSITDHDTLSGVVEALSIVDNYNFKFITGVELTTHIKDKEIHLLSYGVDPFNDELNEKLIGLIKSREKRAEIIVSKLANHDINLDIDKIKQNAKGASITRPHIAKEMLESGYVKNYKEAFDNYIGDNLPAFEGKEKFAIDEAIKLVHRAGGKTVVAHPNRFVSKEEMRYMINCGLDGIEVLHPSHNDYYIKYWRRWCIENKLIATGGSDYHGSRPYDEENFGKWNVNVDVIEKLLS